MAHSFGGIQGYFRTTTNRGLRDLGPSPYYLFEPTKVQLVMEPQSTGRYVLSVQNSRPDGRLIEEAFRQDGDDIEVLTLYSAEAALSHLREPRTKLPILMLLAARLPTIDGIEILRLLKADKRLRGIPILIFASYLLPHEVEEFFAEHASSVIDLPGRLEDLENTVRLLKAYWLGIAGLPPQSTAAQSA
jgi:CheY-like chemotaxis protein